MNKQAQYYWQGLIPKGNVMSHPNELESEFLNLSTEQAQHYKAVSWLLNPVGPRGSGRTHLMALAFIEHSLKHNMAVDIFDHSREVNNPIVRGEMIQEIRRIIENTEGRLKLYFSDIHSRRIKIRVKERL